MSKKLGDDFFQNCVAFSKYLNFIFLNLFIVVSSLLLLFAFVTCFRFTIFSGNASQQRPDVVPGAETSGYDESSTSGLTSVSGLTGTSINNPISASGPAAKIGSRPKHKRQDQVQQLSYNHSRLES